MAHWTAADDVSPCGLSTLTSVPSSVPRPAVGTLGGTLEPTLPRQGVTSTGPVQCASVPKLCLRCRKRPRATGKGICWTCWERRRDAMANDDLSPEEKAEREARIVRYTERAALGLPLFK